MTKQPAIYTRRRRLRTLERWWSAVERAVTRLTTANARALPFNPLYYTGQLAIFLLVVLTVTGIYLTVVYRPGTDRAYASVQFISSGVFGSVMRSVHRYASDALVVVTLLHALKTLLSDRFWGSRWLAWLSGWVMLVIIWSIGVMGYWLIWDQNAQRLTQYVIEGLGGPLAYAFFGPNLASSTFALFVIVLFLHVFVPLLLVIGILIHVLRLARARYWAPRWLMAAAVGGLMLLALLLPVASDAPADFSTVLRATRLDWLYLGFIPVTERLGGVPAIGLSLAGLALLSALPWLTGGRHDGPAVVIEPNCTGCGACVRECPYAAIDLVNRDDDTPYASLAVVKPNLCTGCGICVGACPDRAIELDRLPSPVVRQDLQRTLRQIGRTGTPAVTVYACDRHHALGTLPPVDVAPDGVAPGGAIPLLQAKLPPRVTVGTWPDAAGQPQPVMTCVVPCSGMLHPNWASETIEAGGAGALVVTCPEADCAHREGPHWIGRRLVRRRTLRSGNTHFIEAAPGDRRAVLGVWHMLVGDAEQARAAMTSVGLARAEQPTPSAGQRARALLPGVVILLLVLLLSVAPTGKVGLRHSAESRLRIVLNHGGQIMAAAGNLPPEIAAKLAPGVDPVAVLGAERFPIDIEVTVDGTPQLAATYAPRGLRREGAVYAVETLWLPPGDHAVTVRLRDDGTTWRTVFDGTVTLAADQAARLLWDSGADAFALRP